MATIFCDGFDPYLTTTDMLAQWTGQIQSLSATTPFSVGQSMVAAPSAASWGFATFSSGTNEATVYGTFRLQVTGASSATNFSHITFMDGATTQCTIRFNTDGSIGLYTGGPTGSLIQTYSAVYTPSAWNSFQFQVTINNTTGSIALRLNGSVSNLLSNTGVNTRGGSSNNYTNGLALGSAANGAATGRWDDLYINNTSGNAPTSWPGDLRALQQYPTSTTSTNFSVFPTTGSQIVNIQAALPTFTSGTATYHTFSPTLSGTITGLSITLSGSVTGHIKISIFDATGAGGGPGAVITNGTANTLTNPASGAITITWPTPPFVAARSTYWMGLDADASWSTWCGTGFSLQSTTAYASFPSANPTTTTIGSNSLLWMTFAYAADNSYGVQQLIEDGDTTYTYASTVVEDKYSLSQIPTTYAVTAVTYYTMWRRSDVGTRTAQLSVTANGSSDTAEITNAALPTSYAFQFKTLELDPTGAAWTAANVNSAVLGIAITV